MGDIGGHLFNAVAVVETAIRRFLVAVERLFGISFVSDVKKMLTWARTLLGWVSMVDVYVLLLCWC